MNKNLNYTNKICGKILVSAILVFAALGFAQDTLMTPYCCYPPFVTEVVPPNIMILMDNSGSMGDRAYTVTDLTMGGHDDSIRWYGYWDPNAMYSYASERFHEDPAGIWPGHILNLVSHSRGDLLRKALVGGAATSQFGAGADPIRLVSEGRNSWTVRYRRDASSYNTFTISHSADETRISCTRTGVNPPINGTLSGARGRIDIPRDRWIGVIQRIAGEEVSPGQWEWRDNAPRFGLFIYNLTWTGNVGGHIVDYIGGATSLNDMCNHVQNTGWTTNTPLCETYFEIIHYFTQSRPHYMNSNYTPQPGGQKDPQYENPPGGGGYIEVWCRRNFCLAITDGEPTAEQPIPDNDALHLPNATGLRTFGRPYSQAQGGIGEHFDEIAYYANTTDLRAPGYQPVADSQSLALYIIFTFGRGSNLLKTAAKCGGFIEKGGAPGPDQLPEWDADSNGVPDAYFEAENGDELEAAIMKAITQMLATVSSASGIAVVTPGTGVGGATSQAQFYPRHNFPTGEVLDWIGKAQGLWMDPYGYLREDTQRDYKMHLQNDYIIEMYLSGNIVMVDRWLDVNGDGLDPGDIPQASIPLDDIEVLWDGSDWLWTHTSADRNIITFVDLNRDQIVDTTSELFDFDTTNATLLRPYLNVGNFVHNDSVAKVVIEYIRGTDFPDLRARTAGGNVWKLADIINSGAQSVQGAIERYDFIYGDMSYAAFKDSIEDRRQVVYVGGNDGMLHCFNNGIPVEDTVDPMITMEYLADAYDIGQEMWAFIPYNLLPHLRWLTDPYYCHVYYVDLRPYLTEAQIFPPDAVHPHGWGTILVGAMRLGGMEIISEADTCMSSVFCIDVTDPANPVPMWEFSDPSTGLIMCYPTAVKVDSSWFLVFGSGPTNCEGECELMQQASVYALDLATGAELERWTLLDPQSFISNIFAADWGIDYTVDRIYFGDCFGSQPNWNGKIYRILTNNDEDPTNWTLQFVFDMGSYPIVAEGSITTDDYNHLWVTFGTGRFFTDNDELDLIPQRYIGIREDTARATTVAGLYDVSNVWIDTLGHVNNAGGITTFDELAYHIDSIGGWWREFDTPGERNLTTSLIFGGAVLFTTFIPTEDICSYGGEGNLWALYFRTGTAYYDPFLNPDTANPNRLPEKVSVGPGMPSEPALYVSGDKTKVFIQAGGSIVSPETGIPGLPKSGVILWKGR